MAIMSAIVWYVLPGLLGRTYDLKNETVGPDIFKHADTANAKKIEHYVSTSEYSVVSELSEANDFLDVSGKLSLKLKTGAVNIDGTGNYLKDSTSFQHRVDLLVKVHYETVTFTLPSSIKPIPEWQEVMKEKKMTHYIRSITYGGDLIASIRFIASNEADKSVIKGQIQGELSSKSGSFGAGLKANLEKIKHDIRDSASMDINYFATVPLKDIPRTIEGLTNLVDDFPKQTKEVNKGLGVPLKMEVFSLEGLKKDFQTYSQTLALADQMEVLDEQYSDIRIAKQRLADWLKTVPPILEKSGNDKIGLFNTKLDNIEKIFGKTIANMDLSAKAKGEQFKPAFDAYLGDREEAFPNMYVKDLSRLKKEVLDGTPSIEEDFGGAHFTHWGSPDCTAGTKEVFKGTMSSTASEGISSTQFECMPEEKEYNPKHGENDQEDIEDFPQIKPVAFVSRKKGVAHKLVKVHCTSCRVPGKSTSTMLSGTSDCPANWATIYKGVLVSTDYQNGRGELVCLDTGKSFQDMPKDIEDPTVLTEVSPICDTFPCSGGLSESTAIPCAVCSITKITESKTDLLLF